MQWTYRQAARLQSTPAMVASIAVNLYKYILYCTYVIPRITHGYKKEAILQKYTKIASKGHSLLGCRAQFVPGSEAAGRLLGLVPGARYWARAHTSTGNALAEA